MVLGKTFPSPCISGSQSGILNIISNSRNPRPLFLDLTALQLSVHQAAPSTRPAFSVWHTGTKWWETFNMDLMKWCSSKMKCQSCRLWKNSQTFEKEQTLWCTGCRQQLWWPSFSSTPVHSCQSAVVFGRHVNSSELLGCRVSIKDTFVVIFIRLHRDLAQTCSRKTQMHT